MIPYPIAGPLTNLDPGLDIVMCVVRGGGIRLHSDPEFKPHLECPPELQQHLITRVTLLTRHTQPVLCLKQGEGLGTPQR